MHWSGQNYMKETFKYIFYDKVLLIGFILSLFCSVITISSLTLFYQKLPPFIPLYNQLPWGTARLGNTFEFFIPFVIGLTIFIFNFLLANFIYLKIPLLSRILSLTALLSTFFILLFTLRTLQLIL